VATFTKVAGVTEVWIQDTGGVDRNFSSVVNSVSVPKSADVAETTCLTDTAQKRIGTLLDASVSLSGPRDATTEGYIDALIGSASRVRVFPEGSVAGKAFHDGTCVWTSYDTSEEVAGVVQLSAEGQGSGAFTRRIA
jgi:hypothetical protein